MEESLGQKLKAARLSKQLSLRNVQHAVGYSNAYISMLEKDKVKFPSADLFYKLSALYSVDMSLLIGTSQAVPGPSQVKWLRELELILPKLSSEAKDEILNYCKYIEFRDGLNPAEGTLDSNL